LVVTSVDPKEKWRNERERELSRDENLFEKLVRIEKFAEWHRPTVVGGGGRGCACTIL
jgi:hypothetical protein